MATVMRVQERAENSALRGFSVEGQWGGDVAAYSGHLPSACLKRSCHTECKCTGFLWCGSSCASSDALFE